MNFTQAFHILSKLDWKCSQRSKEKWKIKSVSESHWHPTYFFWPVTQNLSFLQLQLMMWFRLAIDISYLAKLHDQKMFWVQQKYKKTYLRESSFNMTRGGWRYWGGAPKIFTQPEGGLWKNCWARRGALKFLIPKGGRAPKKLNR